MEHCRNSTGLIFSSFCYILWYIFGNIADFRCLFCPIACMPDLSGNHSIEVVCYMQRSFPSQYRRFASFMLASSYVQYRCKSFSYTRP